MPLPPRSGFQASPKQGRSADFGGDDKAQKGDAKRNTLSAMLKMFAEMSLAQRQKGAATPENPETDAMEDRDSPEARKDDGMGAGAKGPFGGGNGGAEQGVARKSKSKMAYGIARSKPGAAKSSKPEGIKKGSKFG